MGSPTADLNEYEAISATIQHYLDGAISGRGDDMKPAFHADATIYGYVGPDLFAGPIQLLFDHVDENEAASDLKARIAGIDITGTIASAKVESDNWGGHRFTDLFNLLKVDGEWKIVNKVFHLHP